MCFEPASHSCPSALSLREGTLVKSSPELQEQTARTLCDGDAQTFLGKANNVAAPLPEPRSLTLAGVCVCVCVCVYGWGAPVGSHLGASASSACVTVAALCLSFLFCKMETETAATLKDELGKAPGISGALTR